MRTAALIRDNKMPEIESVDTITVETSELFVTISKFTKLGDDVSFDMLLITPEEAEKMVAALNNSVRRFKRAGKV